MRVWSRGRSSAIRTSRATVAALTLLLAVAVASAAEMEVDSQGVITELLSGKVVATFDESAVSLFDTAAPPGGYPQLGIGKDLVFDSAGRISSYNFTVPGFSAASLFYGSDPGLVSDNFSVSYETAGSGLSFNPISQSTYLSSSDPWALILNGATFETSNGIEGPVCYDGFCSTGGNPATAVGPYYEVSFSGRIHAVPEPGTLGLMGLALAAMIVALRRNPMSARSRRSPAARAQRGLDVAASPRGWIGTG
jgi:PEP-CTERM motif